MLKYRRNGEEKIQLSKQRSNVSLLIAEKESLLATVDTKEINLEEALEYCFAKIRESDKTWR